MPPSEPTSPVKRPSRDPALTWDVPAPADHADHARHASACRPPFDEAGQAHVEAIVRQQLAAEGAVDADAWAPVVVRLAQAAAAALSPAALAACGATDPRAHHLRIKRLMGPGAPEDSAVVEGIACHKTVVHKRMRTCVERPRIVLLAGALEFQRPKLSLSSFDALIEPEKEYLRGAVDRLMKVRPDVVLVERGVARHAQDLLLEAGVSVVVGVKAELLARLAEATGGQVAASIEELKEEHVGTCEAFEAGQAHAAAAAAVVAAAEPPPPPLLPQDSVAASGPADATAAVGALTAPPPVSQTEPPASIKPLMLFRGCPRQVGATVLLRGADGAELARVKRVVAFAAYAAYWNRLEAAFMADQMVAIGACLGQADVASAAAAVAQRSSSGAAAARGGGAIFWASPHVSAFVEPEVEGGIQAPAALAIALERRSSSSGSSSSISAGGGAAPGEERGGAGAAAVPADRGAPGPRAAGSEACASQQLWLSISCRNPAKGVLCEPPHLHSMPFYREADLPLSAFIAAAAPPNRKCPHPQCGDGAALHLRSFAHGDGLVTLSSVRLPAGKELPGADEGTVWLWTRPLGRSAKAGGGGFSGAPQRVPLSPEATCMSFAHLLALLLDARHLGAEGCSLQSDVVRYLGRGPALLCLHYTRIAPYGVRLPPPTVALASAPECGWLQEEIKALTEEADEAFGALQAALLGKLPVLEGAEPGASSSWSEHFVETRTKFMETVRDTVALVDGKLAGDVIGTEESIADVVTKAMQELGQLRRMLAGLEEIIPAGLVARYVSMFEDQRSAVGSTRGSPWSSSAEGAAAARHVDTGYNSRAAGGVRADQTAELPKVVVGFQRTEPPLSHPLVAHEGEDAASPGTGRAVSQLTSRLGQLVVSRQRTMADPPPAAADPPNDELLSGALSEPELRVGSHLVSHFDEWKALLNGTPTSQEGPTPGPSEVAASPAPSALGRESPIKLEEQQGADNAGDTGMLRSHANVFRVAGRALLPIAADGVCVTVYDDEPTSLISYFLSTRQYEDYLRDATTSSTSPAMPGGCDAIMASSLQLDCQMLVEDPGSGPQGGGACFQLTAYYAPQFAALRRQCVAGGESAYLASMSRCSNWASQGGKSSAWFAKTRDDRYVVKQLSRAERQSFLGFAPDYFRYLTGCADRGTALAKVVGVYQICVQYPSGAPPPFGGRDGVMDLLVMENLFYGRTVQRIFDLKGSSRDRYTTESAAVALTPLVLLDENLRELHQTTPTLVAPAALERLQRALWADTDFLAALDVMDYSLLVGFDRDRQELVVGVIDYIRQYTWDKQVESWVKKSGILGGAGKQPTIVSPRQYSRRFRAAMLSYFSVVPGLEQPAPALEPDAVVTGLNQAAE